MRTIQDLGQSILSQNPDPIYIIGGSEYGVKLKYIEHLQSLYGSKIESQGLTELVDMFSKHHIIPLKPSLYVVRYDSEFVSSLDNKLADKVKSAKIVGTVVCIYEDAKSLAKIDKYLPNVCYSVEPVSKKFIDKYLHRDFPSLDDRSIAVANKLSDNYSHAYCICAMMSHTDPEKLNRLSEDALSRIFGVNTVVQDEEIRKNIAARKFSPLVEALSSYSGDISSIYYVILNCLLELEKVLCNKGFNSDLKEYSKYWKIQDVYYMFEHTYSEIKKSRTSSVNIDNSLIYLFGLLKFSSIPSLEVMHSGI